jgi:hypothetical protein
MTTHDWYLLLGLIGLGVMAIWQEGRIKRLEREVRFLSGTATGKDAMDAVADTAFRK